MVSTEIDRPAASPSPGARTRPTVLYLGGLGRSGTTVLERVLGELPGVCSVGELVHLWRRGVLDGETCGCGRSFGSCPFWAEVGRVAFGGWSRDARRAHGGAARRSSTAPGSCRGCSPRA